MFTFQVNTNQMDQKDELLTHFIFSSADEATYAMLVFCHLWLISIKLYIWASTK